MTPAEQRALVAEAALAPSVHNVQPARWRFDGDTLLLWEDMDRRLPAGDPEGRDAAMSLGAAAEGMALALSARGLRMIDRGEAELPDAAGVLNPRRRFAIEPGGEADPLLSFVPTRRSHRGRFEAAKDDDRETAERLAAADCTAVTDPHEIAAIAKLVDRAGHGFFRDRNFRTELLSWMRLRRSDQRWAIDGLNADAMAMSRIDAWGAELVLGPLFGLLDRIGLAAPLTAEAKIIAGAAGILLFHRPAGEPRFDSGRAFYRMWLRAEAAGLRGAVMASLADDPVTAAAVGGDVPDGRVLVSALRIGRPPAGSDYPRARLPVEALLV
jgi:nitroreductase